MTEPTSNPHYERAAPLERALAEVIGRAQADWDRMNGYGWCQQALEGLDLRLFTAQEIVRFLARRTA